MQSSPQPSLRWRLAQSLELKWWRRYLGDRSPADYLAQKRAYWERTLDQLGWTVESGARVLDAGCGPAGVFLAVADRQRVTAVDPLLLDYERELPVFRRADHPAVEFLALPLERLPPGHYAAIYCCNAINHVSDWDGCLDVLTRAARPGTRLLLTSDVHRHRWLRPLFRALPGDLLHPQQHRATDYRRALAARGWRIGRETILRRAAIFNYVAWVATYAGPPYARPLT